MSHSLLELYKSKTEVIFFDPPVLIDRLKDNLGSLSPFIKTQIKNRFSYFGMLLHEFEIRQIN